MRVTVTPVTDKSDKEVGTPPSSENSVIAVDGEFMSSP